MIIVNDPEVLARVKAQIDPPVAETAPAMIVVLTRKIVSIAAGEGLAVRLPSQGEGYGK